MNPATHPPTDILIEPSDWYIANWRNLPPCARPQPRPFSLADGCARLNRVSTTRFNQWDWSAAEFPAAMTSEEGQFWLSAFVRAKKGTVPIQELVADLQRRWPQPPSREEIIRRFYDSAYVLFPELVPALFSQYDIAAVVDTLLDPWKHPQRKGNKKPAPWDLAVRPLMHGFRRLVRPYLTPGEVQSAQRVVQAELTAWQHLAPGQRVPSMLVSLAACVGLSGQVARLIAGARKNELHTWLGSQMFFALYGLPDAQAVRKAFTRYRLTTCAPEAVRGLLAHLESDALEFILPEILQVRARADAENLVPEVARVLRPSTARAMLELTLKSRGPAPAQRWLDEHPELAVAGLVPLVDDKELGEAAIAWLRGLIRGGRGALVEQHLATVDQGLAARVGRLLETTIAAQAGEEYAVPDWFPPVPSEPPDLPPWLDLAALPAILIAGKRLPVEQVAAVLSELDACSLEGIAPLLTRLRRHADPRSLDAFAWAAFARWLANSSPAGCNWPITALGALGGETVCRNLIPIILRWPSQARHARATQGLECLRAIGTNAALRALAEIAQKGRSRSIGEQATTVLAQLASAQGLTREQLDDCLVPTLGLDQAGHRLLEYGSRAFSLSLGPGLEPRLLDEKGNFVAELPEMRPEDDPVKVEAARSDWQFFQRQVNEVVLAQRARLRQALAERHRWQADHFERHLVRHPLTNYLARPLVWGVLDSPFQLRLAFRVTEGRTCVDIAGSPVALEPTWQVCIAHPTDLPAEERLIWSDVLAENGLTQPFAQLQEEVFVLEPQQLKRRGWRPNQPIRLPAAEFNRLLAQAGWRPIFGRAGPTWVKEFTKWGLVAELLDPPASTGNWSGEELTAGGFFFARRQGQHLWSRTKPAALVLKEIDPILLNDVLRTMHALSAASK